MPRIHPSLHALALACFCLGVGGCSLFKPQPATPTSADSAEELLRQGDGLIAAGDFDGAAKTFDQLLEEHPDSEQAPQAMLELAAVYLSPESPLRDTDKGTKVLAHLTQRHPQSPWSLVADAFLLVMQDQAERLEPSADDGELAAEELLHRGGERLMEGDFDGAAIAFNMLLAAHPESDQAPRALFQLAAVYLLPESPLHDRRTGNEMLTDLAEQYPDSPWAPLSEAMLDLTRTNVDLRRAIAALRAQLDELKKIDLEPDG